MKKKLTKEEMHMRKLQKTWLKNNKLIRANDIDINEYSKNITKRTRPSQPMDM